MRKLSVTTAFIGLLAVLCVSTGLAQDVPGKEDLITDISRDRLAQTGMKFLTVSLDPRAAALSSAVTAQAPGSSVSMFYNPASMGDMENSVDASLGQVQWIGDVYYNYASAAFKPLGGSLGVVGLSLVSVDYGDFLGTIRYDNERGYIDMGTYSPSALAFGMGYARAVTTRFSVGGNVKFVRQSIGESVMALNSDGSGVGATEDFAESSFAFDFGTVYKTGFRSLNFAMSVRNFSREVTYVEESFELPLTFRIGVAMDMMDFTSLDSDMHAFVVGVDAVRPRDYSEQIRVGGEYLFYNTLALRGGYTFPTDEQGVNLGVGLQQELMGASFNASYAFSQWNRFEDVNRISVRIGL
jgi:hypothetical protein